jgi:hypothetical protein
MRFQPFKGEQCNECRGADTQRDERSVRNVLRHAHDVTEKALLGDVDAEQLGKLIEHNDHSDPRLETGQHGCRNEIGQKSEPKN